MMENEQKIKKLKKDWENEVAKKAVESKRERKKEFKNTSEILIERLYTPADIEDFSYERDLGFPGMHPFTRGIYTTGYRGQLWTRRPITGFQSPKETNDRFKYLLKQGQTGLHLVFDMPTWTGYDSDHPLSEGELGLGGVAIDSFRDIETLLEGISLDQVSVSYSHAGPVIFSMILALAQKQGVPFEKLRGTTQNDYLMYHHSCHFFDLPLEINMKMFADVVEYATKYVPNWNTVGISGYNTREGGCSAAQEIAFAFGDAMAYIEVCLDRGLKIDDFVQRFSFHINAHNNFFEEICKYRAMRRMWAKILRHRFKAKDPRSWMFRCHTQTSGASLTAQQPYNNIIRSTIQALAAVLGGTQSMHVSCYDESYSVPSQQAAHTSLNTQNIIAFETGVADTIDPLGGSYYVESLTNKLEEKAWKILDQIEEQGGMVEAALKGWVQNEKAKFNREYHKEIENKERIIVGVNEFVIEEERPIELFRVPPSFEKEKIAELRKLKDERDQQKVNKALENLRNICQKGENTIDPTIEAVKNYATFGEIYELFRQVFGRVTREEISNATARI